MIIRFNHLNLKTHMKTLSELLGVEVHIVTESLKRYNRVIKNVAFDIDTDGFVKYNAITEESLSDIQKDISLTFDPRSRVTKKLLYDRLFKSNPYCIVQYLILHWLKVRYTSGYGY